MSAFLILLFFLPSSLERIVKVPRFFLSAALFFSSMRISRLYERKRLAPYSKTSLWTLSVLQSSPFPHNRSPIRLNGPPRLGSFFSTATMCQSVPL